MTSDKNAKEFVEWAKKKEGKEKVSGKEVYLKFSIPKKLAEVLEIPFTTPKERGANMPQGTGWQKAINDLSKDVNKKFDILIDSQKSFVEKVDARFDKVDARLDKMDKRFDKVDARLDKMDARLDNIDKRLETIEQLPTIKKELNELNK